MLTKLDYSDLFRIKYNFENLSNVDEKLNIIFGVMMNNYDILNKIRMEVSDIKNDVRTLQTQLTQLENATKYK